MNINFEFYEFYFQISRNMRIARNCRPNNGDRNVRSWLNVHQRHRLMPQHPNRRLSAEAPRRLRNAMHRANNPNWGHNQQPGVMNGVQMRGQPPRARGNRRRIATPRNVPEGEPQAGGVISNQVWEAEMLNDVYNGNASDNPAGNNEDINGRQQNRNWLLGLLRTHRREIIMRHRRLNGRRSEDPNL